MCPHLRRCCFLQRPIFTMSHQFSITYTYCSKVQFAVKNPPLFSPMFGDQFVSIFDTLLMWAKQSCYKYHLSVEQQMRQTIKYKQTSNGLQKYCKVIVSAFLVLSSIVQPITTSLYCASNTTLLLNCIQCRVVHFKDYPRFNMFLEIIFL